MRMRNCPRPLAPAGGSRLHGAALHCGGPLWSVLRRLLTCITLFLVPNNISQSLLRFPCVRFIRVTRLGGVVSWSVFSQSALQFSPCGSPGPGPSLVGQGGRRSIYLTVSAGRDVQVRRSFAEPTRTGGVCGSRFPWEGRGLPPALCFQAKQPDTRFGISPVGTSTNPQPVSGGR